MKEIIRSLYNARLKESKPSNSPFIFILYCGNVISHNIKPMILFIGLIYIFEIICYKCRVFNSGPFL